MSEQDQGHPYQYDVFLSFTGTDREWKDQLRQELEAQGYKCYDADRDCEGRFQDHFPDALRHSRVYLMVLTDSVMRDPNTDEDVRQFSLVRDECTLACDLEAHGRLNMVVLCMSPRFQQDLDIGWPSTEMSAFFYNRVCSFSKIFGSSDDGALLDGITMQTVSDKCSSFINARKSGRPVPSVSPVLGITKEHIPSHALFKGRKTDVNDILDAFAQGHRAVVLSGMGGIGKTTLAEKIAAQPQFRCPQIVYVQEQTWHGIQTVTSAVSYTQSVNEVLARLPVSEQHREKLSVLQALPENVLLVIDNYNTVTEEDIQELLRRLRCRLLITTRVIFDRDAIEHLQQNKVYVRRVVRLDEPDAREMFAETCGNAVDERQFAALYDSVGGHTITLCIIAKILKEHKQSLGAWLENTDWLKNNAQVRFVHNDDAEQDTVLGHLRQLFEGVGLSDGCQRILRCMSLLSDGLIPADELMQALQLGNRNEINMLVRNGWLESVVDTVGGERCESLFLHPLLSQLAVSELHPTQENTADMIAYLVDYAERVQETMTYTDAAWLSERLFYACDTLVTSAGELPEVLWDCFAKINHLLGDNDNTALKVQKLQERLEDAPTQTTVAVYRDMLILERQPTRMDILERYFDTLDLHAEDYKWVLRALSVTLQHVVGVDTFRGQLESVLEKAFRSAVKREDDFALVDILMHCILSDYQPKKKVAEAAAYVRRRRKQHVENGALLYLDTLCLSMKGLSYDWGKVQGVLNAAIGNDYGTLLKLSLRHPIVWWKMNSLKQKTAMLRDDPFAAPLQVVADIADRLVDDGELDTAMMIRAAVDMHRLRLEQQQTLVSAADAVVSIIGIIKMFPEAMVQSATLAMLPTDSERITIRDLSNWQVAAEINQAFNNSEAVAQRKHVLDILKCFRPEGHYDIATAMIAYADACAIFGKTQEAMEAYTEVYLQQKQWNPESVLLADVARKMLRADVRFAEIPHHKNGVNVYPLWLFREVKDTALSALREDGTAYYEVIYNYTVRLLDLQECRKMLLHFENAAKMLRKLPSIVHLTLIRNIYEIEIRLRNQRCFDIAKDYAQLKKLFVKSKNRIAREEAKIYVAYTQACDVPAQERARGFEKALSVCLRYHRCEAIANACVMGVIDADESFSDFETRIRRKKHRQECREKWTWFLSDCVEFSEGVQAEGAEKCLWKLVQNTVREQREQFYGISAKRYKRIHTARTYYKTVFNNMMNILIDKHQDRKIAVNIRHE